MTTHQIVWLGCPLTAPYGVTVDRPSYVANVLGPPVIPRFYHTVIERPSPKENRKFFLDRAVFDLVDSHSYLSLTDPKLLGWYLHLSPDDRKIIQDEGGFHHFLQRHPALELSVHHVYVKYNIGNSGPAQSSMTSNRQTTSKAKTCGCGNVPFSAVPDSHPELEMLSSNMRAALTLLGCSGSGNGSQKHPRERVCHTEPLHHLQDCFHTAFNSPTQVSALSQLSECGPSWRMDNRSGDAGVLTSCAVDVGLERCRRGGEPEQKSQVSVTEDLDANANFTCAEGTSLQSEWPSIKQDPPSVHSADDDTSLSLAAQIDSSIWEEDESTRVRLPSEDVKAHHSGFPSDPVSPPGEAPVVSRDTLKCDQSAGKLTSPLLSVTTCDVMVGTEPAPCTSAFTQTEDRATSDKHVLTEVHMADLDYLAEEFIKLRMAKEELRELKKKSGVCELRKECDCVRRAQQAELCLLALQYSMCIQHCWRLYYTSAEGGQLTPLPGDPTANVGSLLQKLESDYNHMRDKILKGARLEDLKPLSVDSEKISTGTRYSPARIIGDMLDSVPSWSSQEPQTPNISAADNQSRNGCQLEQLRFGSPLSQHSQRQEQMKKSSKAGRAASLISQSRDVIHNASRQEEKHAAAACKELNTNEAWYDAEEDLEPAAAAETGQDQTMNTRDQTSDSAGEEAKSSVVCISNLPSNVTESDVMKWFEKYRASEVSISALNSDLRVAIVMTNGHQSAEAAVRELNGCSRQGHTLHVERISRAVGRSYSQASASFSGSESTLDTKQTQAPETDPSSTDAQLARQPPLSSNINIRNVVCVSPTAKGTCVPQHFGTMGSFDSLMAELTQRHPGVGRQRIMDALMELKARHRGALTGLPLSTIREMTSELLTSPAGATQS